jgi:hypothetical protein
VGPGGGGAYEKSLAQYLNTFYDPRANHETGDHHLPFGVAVLGRAAAKLKMESKLTKPVAPLPPGVVA